MKMLKKMLKDSTFWLCIAILCLVIGGVQKNKLIAEQQEIIEVLEYNSRQLLQETNELKQQVSEIQQTIE